MIHSFSNCDYIMLTNRTVHSTSSATCIDLPLSFLCKQIVFGSRNKSMPEIAENAGQYRADRPDSDGHSIFSLFFYHSVILFDE